MVQRVSTRVSTIGVCVLLFGWLSVRAGRQDRGGSEPELAPSSPPDVCIGTERALCDVAKHGKVKLGFCEGTSTAAIDPEEHKTTFWARSAVLVEIGTPTVSTSPPGVAAPVLSGALFTSRRIPSSSATDLHMEYLCRRGGTVVVTVVIPVVGSSNFRIVVTKTCVDQVFAKLKVGSTAGSDDVVAVGAPRPAWASPHTLESTYRTRRTFFVALSRPNETAGADVHPTQRMSRPRTTVVPPILDVAIEGTFNLTASGTLELSPNVTNGRELTLRMRCTAAGTSVVTLIFMPWPLYQDHVVGPTGAVNAGDADVLLDGAVTEEWSAKRFTMDQQATAMHFYVGLGPVAELEDQSLTQLSRAPVVQVQPPNVASASLVLGGALAPINASSVGRAPFAPLVALAQGTWSSVKVQITCLAAGDASDAREEEPPGHVVVAASGNASNRSVAGRAMAGMAAGQGEAAATVTVSFPLDVYDAAVWSFQKLCGGSKTGLEVELPKGGSDLPASEVLRSSPKATVMVVHDGRATPAWAPSSRQRATVSGDVEHSQFVVKLGEPNDPASPKSMRGGKQAIGVPRLLLDNVSQQEGWLQTAITGKLRDGGTFKRRIHKLRVDYTCPKFGWAPAFWGAGWGGRTANLTMQFDLVEPRYQPVRFTWSKKCKGWLETTGGVTAAVFIVLAILGSIGGCVYLGLRGVKG